MPLILQGATSGQATLQATDAQTVTITMPATSGTLVTTGGAQTIEFADGSASAPSITNSGDTNTGIFFPAADTIAFTEGGVESMRIDSAGFVGIGCTPVTNLQVNASSDVGIAMSNSSSVTSGNRGTISMFNSSTSSVGYIRFGADTDNVGTDIQFANRPVGGSLTERMRITSTGSVLINGTDTSYSPYIQATGNADNFNIAVVKNTGTNYSTGVRLVTFVNSSNAIAGVISHSGVTSVTYGTSSDERLKENIVDAPNALDKVMDIKIRSYDWKEDSSHVEYGLVAQELHSVYGEPVGVGGEDITKDAWSIEYGRLTPILLKAIQELKATVDAQAARIAALEGAK